MSLTREETIVAARRAAEYPPGFGYTWAYDHPAVRAAVPDCMFTDGGESYFSVEPEVVLKRGLAAYG